MDNNRTQARSIRATAEVFEQLKKIAASGNFPTQGDALGALVSLWEQQKAKEILPSQGTMIDDLRTHMNAITGITLQLLESNANAEDRARDEFSASFKAQALILEKTKKELDTASSINDRYRKRIKELEKTEQSLRDSLKDKNSMLDDLRHELSEEKKRGSRIDKLLARMEDHKQNTTK